MSLSKSSSECVTYLATVQGRSRGTVENYQRTYLQFLAFLQHRGLEDTVRSFTVNAVMDFCSYLGTRGVVGNTILNKLHALSTLARYLMKRSDGRGRPLLTHNPTLGFDRPESTQPETKFFYPEELQTFLSLPCHPNLALTRAVLLDTGIRRLEAVEANVGDLQEVDGTHYLTIAVKGRRQRGAQRASVPLSVEIAEQVKDALLSRGLPPPEAPLLLTQEGKRWTPSQLSQRFIVMGRQAGLTRLTASPHKLRHTANVIARQSGLDALTRQSLLNHRSARTLARYDHLVPQETARAREATRAGLENYLGKTAMGVPATAAPPARDGAS